MGWNWEMRRTGRGRLWGKMRERGICWGRRRFLVEWETSLKRQTDTRESGRSECGPAAFLPLGGFSGDR